MPYGDPDPLDPNMLVGVPVHADREAIREMAYTFAEEFSAQGLDEERLMDMFRRPFYSGPHRAYSILGEAEVAGIVAECAACWGRVRAVVREPEPDPGRSSEVLIQIGDDGQGDGPKPTDSSIPTSSQEGE